MLANEYILFLRIWNSIWQARMYSSQIKSRVIPLRRVVDGQPLGVLLQSFYVVNADAVSHLGCPLPMAEQSRFTRAYPTKDTSKWQCLFWGNFSLTKTFSHLGCCLRFLLLPKYPSKCLSPFTGARLASWSGDTFSFCLLQTCFFHSPSCMWNFILASDSQKTQTEIMFLILSNTRCWRQQHLLTVLDNELSVKFKRYFETPKNIYAVSGSWVLELSLLACSNRHKLSECIQILKMKNCNKL